jgi:hydroxymethylbilane synthase
LRIATRRSRLALVQTDLVVAALQQRSGVTCEVVPITTTGDVQTDRSLISIGGDGVFVKELFAALLDGRADVAVHSLKDLPTGLPQRLRTGVVPARDDARDALVSFDNRFATIAALPPGATVGTSSVRRAAQLQLLRKDVRVVPLRGNVDTRLRKLHEGECDAAILAFAGLHRLGVLDSLGGSSPLPLDEMVPAAGQGALFVQCRSDDAATLELLRPLEDPSSALATSLERAFLARLGGGCIAPIGAHVTVAGGTWELAAIVVATDGTSALRRSRSGSASDAAEAVTAVEEVASDLLASGAGAMIASARLQGTGSP